MEIFNSLKEKMRDKTVDNLCNHLRSIALDAQMVERGRLEEQFHTNWPKSFVFLRTYEKSMGLIEIRNSPINFVSVIQREIGSTTTSVAGSTAKCYGYAYLVPHQAIYSERALRLRSVRVKNLPLVGRVVDIRWVANFQGELIWRISNDVALTESLTMLKEDVEIFSYPSHGESGYWLIVSSLFPTPWWGRSRQPFPSRQQWDCYEAIVHHLVESGSKVAF